MSTGEEVLASDDERDRTAAALGAHWSAGRLNLATFDERTEAAYRATTRRELDALLADLPRVEVPAQGRAPAATPAARRRRRRLMPGYRPFREEIVLRTPRDDTYDLALRHIVPHLGRSGYHLTATDRPGMIRLTHTTSPDWAPAAAILTGGIGLIAFLIRVEKPLTILFSPEPGGGTRLIAFGEAPRSIRAAFASLED
jgi:hypothetical protein